MIKKFKLFIENKSFKDLSEELKEYIYILIDEGFRVEILQFHSNEMNLYIYPSIQSEVDKFRRKSTAFKSLNSLNSFTLKIYPWLKNYSNMDDISWADFLYHNIKNKDFFIEWMDRASEICNLSGYSINISQLSIADGIVFNIRKSI